MPTKEKTIQIDQAYQDEPLLADVRDLLKHETQDVRAAEAVALFCYQVKKWIGAFAAALGGIETLVFVASERMHPQFAPGFAMAPRPAPVLVREFGAAIIFGVILDGVKIPVFARLGIS